MVKNSDERRGAQRILLPKPVPATFGGFAAKLIEVSLVGCQIEHADRLTPRARLALRFKWRGAPAKIDATVIRSEMRSVGGKPAYVSGLEFCQSIEESPAVIREVVEWLTKATAPANVAAPRAEPASESAPAAGDDEAEVVSADYLQCTFADGEWIKLYVSDPKQPPEGFTIPAPSNESEVDVLCRAYERSDSAKRRAMRASFELAIAQKRGA